jgi:hypothetical protein
MNIEIGPRDVLHLLSPVGCLVEAVMLALLFVAMLGCAVTVVV